MLIFNKASEAAKVSRQILKADVTSITHKLPPPLSFSKRSFANPLLQRIFCFSGAFLIPYLIMLALIGKPMYFLELAVGQFGGVGPVALWNCCPIMKGSFSEIFFFGLTQIRF